MKKARSNADRAFFDSVAFKGASSHFDGVRDDARLVRLLLRLFGIGDDLLSEVAVGGQARAGGDELTDDDVLLQADEVVDLALDGGLGQDLGRLLEDRCFSSPGSPR